MLAKELRALGAKDVFVINRAVRCTGDTTLMYTCCLWLRTALKVLKPVAVFDSRDEEQLYQSLKRINWSRYLTSENTFAIDGVVSGKTFTHSKYLALKSKDAVVDQFRERNGVRPSVNTQTPDLLINIHMAETRCTVSLDAAGRPLSKRGYRIQHSFAPINEVLAAGIILTTEWNPEKDFYDPMCGSGTLAIEAALIASNTPPGFRRDFAFQKWLDFQPRLWADIKSDARKRRTRSGGRILGHDKGLKVVQIAQDNARNASVDDIAKFRKLDFLKSEARSNQGVVVINPPYGERQDVQKDLIALYGDIGTRLKHHYPGHDAWIISANPEALKNVALRPTRKIKLFNGPLECKLHKYELYQGSRKGSKKD